ncbi:hypothetical protein [Neoaquamicrobium sediminum]|uniref:hypothetical protein n=1 Tax=Neoaquamicrobium sediminum TaxID=1849104 RepID=UPI001565D0BE|nr:hypothetical protein [Mesorhizobium sediminum]NRC56533.1 hypothetical protein [Mesorhizobium sediminum]
MADYHSPTVVQPVISGTDMTPLERLLRGLVFDTDEQDGGMYLHSWCGPSDVVTLPIGDLHAAWEAAPLNENTCVGTHVAALLAKHDAEAGDDPLGDIDIDLTESGNGWDRMFQDIVRRSATIDEIVVTTSFTCTKMRPDGFGGSVMLITADAIRYRSTTEILEEF